MSSTCEHRDGPPDGASRPRLAVVVSGWPRLSETFVLNDLLGLRRAGMLAAVFATKHGHPSVRQPGVDELDGLVTVLPDGSVGEQASFVAHRLRRCGVAGIHGYFAHRPAAVAETAADLLGVPFGFGAHALDVRKVAGTELLRRAHAAAVVVACNADVAATLTDLGVAPTLVAHGVDLDRFVATEPVLAPGMRALAVGRLVEKKGFDVLVEAMAGTDPAVSLTIVGDGPERDRLRAAVDHHRLWSRVSLSGPVTHDCLPAVYASADVVVVPSRVDSDDDRDGLPNVILEAMAARRPVIASDVAAIATAVRSDVTGLLVAPDDPEALRAAIDALHRDRRRRHRLGRMAREAAVAHHDLDLATRHLVATLGRAYG